MDTNMPTNDKFPLTKTPPPQQHNHLSPPQREDVRPPLPPPEAPPLPSLSTIPFSFPSLKLWRESESSPLALNSCSASSARVSQPAVVVASRHGEATLVCGYKVHSIVQETRFSLVKKTDNQIKEICVLSYTKDYKPSSSGGAIQCLGIPGPNNVTYNISGLQAEDTGFYSCKMEVMYPPPYQTTEGNATFIYVSDLAEQCAQSMEPGETTKYDYGFFFTFLVLLAYSVLITIILIVKRRKRRWDTGNYGQVLQSNYKTYQPYYIPVQPKKQGNISP
ncbi:cytotoxic T-lymphocyte protein 4-like [Gastrophryne carolinensis]